MYPESGNATLFLLIILTCLYWYLFNYWVLTQPKAQMHLQSRLMTLITPCYIEHQDPNNLSCQKQTPYKVRVALIFSEPSCSCRIITLLPFYRQGQLAVAMCTAPCGWSHVPFLLTQNMHTRDSFLHCTKFLWASLTKPLLTCTLIPMLIPSF